MLLMRAHRLPWWHPLQVALDSIDVRQRFPDFTCHTPVVKDVTLCIRGCVVRVHVGVRADAGIGT